MATPTQDHIDIDALVERAVGYLSGAAVSAMVCLGDQLGLYPTSGARAQPLREQAC